VRPSPTVRAVAGSAAACALTRAAFCAVALVDAERAAGGPFPLRHTKGLGQGRDFRRARARWRGRGNRHACRRLRPCRRWCEGGRPLPPLLPPRPRGGGLLAARGRAAGAVCRRNRREWQSGRAQRVGQCTMRGRCGRCGGSAAREIAACVAWRSPRVAAAGGGAPRARAEPERPHYSAAATAAVAALAAAAAAVLVAMAAVAAGSLPGERPRGAERHPPPPPSAGRRRAAFRPARGRQRPWRPPPDGVAPSWGRRAPSLPPATRRPRPREQPPHIGRRRRSPFPRVGL